jgi:hypothetical protein
LVAFHRERGIEPRRGLGWHDDEQYYVSLLLRRSGTRRCLPRKIWWREADHASTSRQGARVIEDSRRPWFDTS